MKTLKALLAMSLTLAPIHRASAGGNFICNLSVLTKAERARDKELAGVMRAALIEKTELSNGYAFRFDPKVLSQLAEWTYIVVKCCQPVHYQVEVGPQPGGALWWRLTGEEGVKEFIEDELHPFFVASASKL
jgi:hypothetical protein